MASPLRALFDSPPDKVLAPYVTDGSTVLEPGPGMGFFTLKLARRVGSNGRVIAVDIQPRMIRGLIHRASKAGLGSRIEARLAAADSMRVEDLKGQVDFVLAYAMVHEMPSDTVFFAEASASLKRGGRLLLVEPAGHVTAEDFEVELANARIAHLEVAARPLIRRNHAALLLKA
jgi:ubiquinone/menaquinone biosynthesis C-methylase UbiE